ncbi:tetratricopeptide repeat protein [Nostoc sp.]|uniref:tetratricopeptide repeat protein n=1 Tax=Nostoc sp. TaxID=1180 RepID=UPI002FFC9BF2
MTEVTPHPDCPFTPKTFELLEKFKNSSSKDFYLTHEKEFKEYIEQPLQKIYRYVAAQLESEMIKKLNLKTNELPKTTKNGCQYNLYHQLSINIVDAYLFINTVDTELRFGLFISQYSNDKPRFITNTQNNRIKEIILQNTHILKDCHFHYSSTIKIDKINFLADWLRLIARQNSKTKNIQVSTHLELNKVLLCSIEELVIKIKETLESVYILFLAATCDDPIREINDYLNPNFNQSRMYFILGLRYYNQKNYKEAVKEYDLALYQTPNFLDAYNYRAKAKTSLGDINGAILDLNQLLLIQPKNAEFYDNRANFYRKQDDYNEAIQDYSQAISINSNYALAYYHRGGTYLEFKTKLKAIASKICESVVQASSLLWSTFASKMLPLIVYFKNWDATQKVIDDLRIAVDLFEKEKDVDNYEEAQRLLNTIHPDYSEPDFSVIYQNVCSKKLQISESVLRRYHLALKTRKFVILSGISGTGKTWLTKAYAEAIGARYLLVPVAPN